jgi:hypothetical protein
MPNGKIWVELSWVRTQVRNEFSNNALLIPNIRSKFKKLFSQFLFWFKKAFNSENSDIHWLNEYNSGKRWSMR